MPIAIEHCHKLYTGSGSAGPFPTTFMFWDDADLRVVKTDPNGVDSLLTLGSDYTITGGDGATGSVTLTEVLASGYTLLIRSDRDFLQSQDFVNANRVTASALDNSLDKLARLVQQIQEQCQRSPALRESVNAALRNLRFPDPLANAGIFWDAAGAALCNGQPGATVSVPQIDTIENYNDDLALAVTTIGAANRLLMIDKAITLDANVTVPANICLWPTQSCRINGSVAVTLTIANLDEHIGRYQWVGTNVTVLFSTPHEVYPEWWPDAEIHPAAYSVKNCNGTNEGGGYVSLLPKIYEVTKHNVVLSLVVTSDAAIHMWPNTGLICPAGDAVIKLADNQDCDVIRSWNWASLDGTNASFATDFVPTGIHLKNLVVQGNHDFNTSGNVLRLFARRYKIDNCIFEEAAEKGFVSRCGKNLGQNDYRDEIMPMISNLACRENVDTGFDFMGPHDCVAIDVVCHNNGGYGIYTGFDANVGGGMRIDGEIHTWQNVLGNHLGYFWNAQHGNHEDHVTVDYDRVGWGSARFSHGTAGILTNLHVTANGTRCHIGLLDLYNTAGQGGGQAGGVAVKWEGEYGIIGGIYLDGDASAGTGLEIVAGAHGLKVAFGYIRYYSAAGGKGCVLGSGGAVNDADLDFDLSNCADLFDYATQGVRNRVKGSWYAAAGQNLVAAGGASPSVTDRFDIAGHVVATPKYSNHYKVSNSTFLVDAAAGTQTTLTIAHELLWTPAVHQVQATPVKNTDVTDWSASCVITACDATNVTVVVTITKQSGTAAATGKVALWVRN